MNKNESDNRLDNAPNLGEVVTKKLIEAEITNLPALRQIGAEQAFIRLITIDPNCPIQMLYALEGAIQNIRWHGIDKERKEELKVFFKMIQIK